VLVVPLLLLVAVWWFTRELFGPLAALIAVFLLATEPNVIGNAIVVQNDVAAALALVLFVIAVKGLLCGGAAVRKALLLGVALGIALVTKYSLVVLLPISFGIVIVWGGVQLIRKQSSFRSVALSFFLLFITAYVVLIAFYAFHIDRIEADESSKIASWFYFSANSADVFKRFVMWLPPLLPRYFVYGIDMVVQDSREGRPAFLLGAVSEKGWWYYFPVAFALKTTVPFLIASIGGLVWALVNVFARKRYAWLCALLPAVLYLALTMTSHLNIGVRHLLPMFPFVATLGAGFTSTLVEVGLHRSRSVGIALGSALAAVTFAPLLSITISTFPNYLTYFSPLAGGTARGWQTLSDSNVETGQEVKPLAKYLKGHGENRVTGIMVGGEFMRFYGVELKDFPGWYDEDDNDSPATDDSTNGDNSDDDSDSDENPVNPDSQPDTSSSPAATIDTNYVAIGAWYFSEIDLTDKQKQIIDFYRAQKPEAMVGNSIFVFRRDTR
jgi:4-amino-4-deoxy-L-arabinose transferase-like glycosyltransferase